MRPHVPDEKHNNHIAAKYMALHIREYRYMLKHCVCCVALYMAQLGGIPGPTTIKRGKSSRKKRGLTPTCRYPFVCTFTFLGTVMLRFHVLRMYGGIARVMDCPVGGVARGGD